MMDLLKDNPWLILIGMGVLVPITGIIFGTITNYMVRVRQAELEAGLKHSMLERGMSAEEIKAVIEATPRRKKEVCGSEAAIRHG